MKKDIFTLNKNLFTEKPKIPLSKEQKYFIQLYKEKIKDGKYNFEDVNCHYCEKNESLIISNYDRYGLPYTSNLRKSCGLIYTSPRKNQLSYNNFYNELYRGIYKSIYSKNTMENFFHSQVKMGYQIYDFIESHVNKNKISSVLEVGCGMGGILLPFKEKNIQILGVDYGSKYIKFGKDKNLNLEIGGIKNIKEKKFDCIIYSHVFEHVLNLQEELAEIKKRLNPQGVLFIAVPGILNLERNYHFDLNRYLQNAHTFNFSLQTLNNLLLKSGFGLIKGNETIEALFSLNGKKTLWKNDFERVLTKLKHYETKKNELSFGFIQLRLKETLYFMGLWNMFFQVYLKLRQINNI